jgi:heme exporter protein CcmD
VTHAVYVWSSYAVTAAVLLGLVASSLVKLRRAERRQRELDGIRPRRRGGTP